MTRCLFQRERETSRVLHNRRLVDKKKYIYIGKKWKKDETGTRMRAELAGGAIRSFSRDDITYTFLSSI